MFNARKMFRKALKLGKEEHDKEYMNIDLEVFEEIPPITNEIPYFPDALTEKQQQIRAFKTRHYNTLHQNLLEDGMGWMGIDLPNRFLIYWRRRTQSLCKGTVSRGATPGNPGELISPDLNSPGNL